MNATEPIEFAIEHFGGHVEDRDDTHDAEYRAEKIDAKRRAADAREGLHNLEITE